MNDENVYHVKLNKNINNLKKVLVNFFKFNPDFNKENNEIINEIELNVKQYCKTILLINNYTHEIINETYKKYTLIDNKNYDIVCQYLQTIYSAILNICYAKLFPFSYM